MRSFYFTAKNIGKERYLTYICGEGTEIDEDVLDYCEENELFEIVPIIYEEDDDFDYLTYDLTGHMTLEAYSAETIKEESVLKILRNISMGMIGIKEYALPLSYIILNKGFMYINPDTLKVQFLYLPVEGDASVSAEFKSFVRQFIASLKYDMNEDLSYVGKLLTYINGDGFNLRGLIGLTEALMKDSGISFDDSADISTDDGAEIVDSVEAASEENPEKEKNSDILSGLGGDGEADAKLPEIGDDGDDSDGDIEAEANDSNTSGIELEEVAETPAAETKREDEKEDKKEEPKPEIPKPAAEVAKEAEIKKDSQKNGKTEEVQKEEFTSAKDMMAKLEEMTGNKVVPQKTAEEKAKEKEKAKKKAKEDEDEEVIHEDGTGVTMTQPVRVSRAAMLKAAAETLEEEAEHEHAAEESKNTTEKKNVITESVSDVKKDSGLLTPADVEKSEKPEDNVVTTSEGAFVVYPYLTRETTQERVMITKNVFKIGKASRGVDFRISGNGAVSRQHAFILHKGEHYYIKDNKSTNHTYVDGKEVPADEEVLLKDGAVITLGGEDFTFKMG